MYELLEKISNPSDLRALERKQLVELARELRDYLIHSVANTGGHLSSNLGTVELTVALHYVFNTPQDRLVWDVGHQTYAHKILTGRRERMSTLRQYGGAAGFPRRIESEYAANAEHCCGELINQVALHGYPPLEMQLHYVVYVRHRLK